MCKLLKMFRPAREELVEQVDEHPWSQPYIRQTATEMSDRFDHLNHIGMDLISAYLLHTQPMRPDAQTIVDAFSFARVILSKHPLDIRTSAALNKKATFVYALRYMVDYWNYYAKHGDRMPIGGWYVLPAEVRNWCINTLHLVHELGQED